jgi:hypothetical protein
MLCVGIVVPCAPALLVSWLNVPASVPHRGDTIYVAPTSLSARYDIWRAEHGPLGRKLFESFCALDDPRKDALRLPMQRLNSAMRRASAVDSAVDLGIALEALFLNDLDDDRGELTFRLRLRMARFLEQEKAKRHDLFQLAGDLYSIRSVAVHTGRIPEKVKGTPSSILLRRGLLSRQVRLGNSLQMAFQIGEPFNSTSARPTC